MESLALLRSKNPEADSRPSSEPGKEKSLLAALKKFQRHLEGFYDERMFLLQMKKFASWLSAGQPNSALFRQRVFQEKSRDSALKAIEDFFGPLSEGAGLKKTAGALRAVFDARARLIRAGLFRGGGQAL